MGIQIVPRHAFRNGPLEPKQTRSRAAIKEIAETGIEIGYDELIYDVLGLFRTSPTNERQLYGENIKGVSIWIRSARLRTADITFIRPAFALVDMGMVREAVLYHKIPNQAPQVAFMVAGMMESALEQIGIDRNRKAG